MAFWGIEVKPGKPYVHRSDDEGGRLHVSQATLGSGSSTKKSIVECKVGDKKPIYLCSLLPERLETCALNLEFEEEEEVTFSIIGSHSVHLSGFFYGDDEDEDEDDVEDDYGSDPYEGNVMVTDSEDDSPEYDSEDEDEDEYIDDAFGMYPPSPIPNSGVKIEEIVDDEKPENALSKKAKKKKSQSSMSDDNENSNRQIVVKAGRGLPVVLSEDEDEDGFPIPAQEKKSDISKSEAELEETINKRIGEKTQKRDRKDDVAHGKKLKRKIDDAEQDEKPERENLEPGGSSVQPDAVISENEVKQKKNKKKKVAEKSSAQDHVTPNSNGKEEPSVAEIGNDTKPSSEKKKDKKKKKKKKQNEDVPASITEKKPTAEKESIPEKQEKEEAKSMQVRTFPNGLVIEELVMGKPNAKRASPGKKVSVHYVGKLKKNGKIFDSNIGRAPFKFRLGIGQVIKGWDVGVNGMRVGDKRRLTIPPAMGYGAKGAGPEIPPNSWLVFDVELREVN